MLNRFKDIGGNDPLNAEVADTMTYYADFTGRLWASHAFIYTLINKVRFDTSCDRQSDVTREINVALELEFPDLMIAARGLESSLKRMQDWRIQWRNFVRGEAFAHEEVEIDGAKVYRVVRAPNEYEEDEGWINDAEVGYSDTLGYVTPLVQVKYEPQHTNGLYMPMDEMFEIEFTPPVPK